MTPRTRAIVLAIVSSILSSVAWIFQGAAVKALTPLAVAAAQGILAGAVYLFHVRYSRNKVPYAQLRRHWKELASFTVLRGVIGSILLCYALMFSTSIKVMFFTKLEPYFVLFWSWLLQNRRISRYHTFLLVLHVAGAVILSTGSKLALGTSQWGDLMLIMAVGILSYSYLQAARLSKELGPIHLNGISAFASGLCLLPCALIVSPASTWNPFTIGWLNVVLLVLFFNVFALTMWYAALRHLEGWLVSALRAVGPVFAAPIAWLMCGQSLQPAQAAGAAIVLCTSALLARDQRQGESVAVVVANAGTDGSV